MTLRSPCRPFRDLVEESAYGLLDGPEHAADRARLGAHLERCEDCRDRLAGERAITDSLNATARLRVSVALEDRVMAAVRDESARRTVRARLSQTQKAALGSAAAAVALGDVLFWAALVIVALKMPLPAGLASVLSTVPEFCRPVLTMASSAADVAFALGRVWGTVAHGLLLLLPSPAFVAASFVTLVSMLTVIAVRRDLHRSPAAARGLQ